MYYLEMGYSIVIFWTCHKKYIRKMRFTELLALEGSISEKKVFDERILIVLDRPY